MKRALGLFLVALALTFSNAAIAQDVTAAADAGDGGFLDSLRLGLHIDLGIANTAGDLDDAIGGDGAKARFAGGFGLSGQYFLTDMFALEVGLGFVGKGFRYTIDDDFLDEEIAVRQKWTYMEIPIGVLLEIKRFQIGAAIAMNIALTGKTKSKSGDNKSEAKWTDEQKEALVRFNLAPKIMLGYAIPFELPFGTIYAIPGMDFSFHLIDEYDGPDDDNTSYRSVNVMFRLGAAFGF